MFWEQFFHPSVFGTVPDQFLFSLSDRVWLTVSACTTPWVTPWSTPRLTPQFVPLFVSRFTPRFTPDFAPILPLFHFASAFEFCPEGCPGDVLDPTINHFHKYCSDEPRSVLVRKVFTRTKFRAEFPCCLIHYGRGEVKDLIFPLYLGIIIVQCAAGSTTGGSIGAHFRFHLSLETGTIPTHCRLP